MNALQLTIALLLCAGGLRVAEQATTPPACVIGDQALAQGQPQLAVEQYLKCLPLGQPGFKTLSNLGMAYAGLNQFDQAIRYYGQALALDPGSPQVRFNLGLAYLKTNHPQEAAKEFARTLMSDPNNMKALELLAVCHFQIKNFELAAFESEQVLKALPNENSASFLLGSCLLRLGAFKDAIPLIYSSIEKNNSATAHVVLGEAFLGVKAYAQALKEFEEAEKMAPDTEGLYSQIGTARAGLGETSMAIAEFEKALEKNSNDFEANYYLGHLKRLSNDMDEARKYLAKAESLRPGEPSVAYEYAVFAMQANDYPKAESLLTNIIQEVPSYIDAHVLLAEVYFHLHQTEDGKREKALVDAMKVAEQAQTDIEGKAREEASQGKTNPSSPPKL
ncbi:MAG TPA: tetratricopeptide repeat protein [Terriglobia bacterium]|nr:tetratricopeptide repeat protein [Terriglobia bacterium]